MSAKIPRSGENDCSGELSLVSAARTDRETGANEWVGAHEKPGRNR